MLHSRTFWQVQAVDLSRVTTSPSMHVCSVHLSSSSVQLSVVFYKGERDTSYDGIYISTGRHFHSRTFPIPNISHVPFPKGLSENRDISPQCVYEGDRTKRYWTKWYGQNGIRTKWYWTKWYGQNGRGDLAPLILIFEFS